MKLRIGYFYPKLLNLYGDNGNVEILVYRAKARGIDTKVINISTDFYKKEDLLNKINLVFMGGGPDSSQKSMYKDLINNKGPMLKEYVENGGVGLFICGAYQLLGHYYKSADGSMLNGPGIFDLYTQHFGNDKPRCIGNVSARINPKLVEDKIFTKLNNVGNALVGFENHGGRTYLGENVSPLSKIITGFGNNGEDYTEGAIHKNAIGTYLHGPVLSKNPHLADYLIAKATKSDNLELLEDSLVIHAHTASLKLSQ